MTRRRATIAVIGCLLCVSTSGVARQPQRVEPGSGVHPNLVMGLQSFSRSSLGGLGTAMSFDFFGARDWETLFVWGGSREFPSLCAVGSGNKPQEGALATWRADARLVSLDASGATFDIRWSRTVNDASDVDGSSIDRTYHVRLAEGAVLTLDVLRTRQGSDLGPFQSSPGFPDCDGAAVTLQFKYEENQSLANSLLEYDVWLVDRDRAGHETIDHLTPRGLQGQQMEYAFRRIAYGRDGLVADNGPLGLEVRGRVTGRARPDGRIDIVVSAERTLRLGSLGNGDGGSRQATVEDGETIELELPGPAGSVRDEGHDLDLAALLRGQRTAIRVVTRRVS